MASRMTAKDVERGDFKRAMRGLDADDVQLHLKAVAAEIERLNLENAELHESLGRLRAENDEHRKHEQTLRQTLVTAQKMSEDLTRKARAEADLIVQEARQRAERTLLESQDQLVRLESEISRCKLERDLFERRLRNTVEEHLTLLDRRDGERDSAESRLRVVPRAVRSEAG